MATQLYSRAIQDKAAQLLANAEKWARGSARLPSGENINVVLFSSSRDPKVVYLTWIDGRSCSCPAAQKSRSGNCCHKLATRTAANQARELATRPAQQADESAELEWTF